MASILELICSVAIERVKLFRNMVDEYITAYDGEKNPDLKLKYANKAMESYIAMYKEAKTMFNMRSWGQLRINYEGKKGRAYKFYKSKLDEMKGLILEALNILLARKISVDEKYFNPFEEDENTKPLK